MANIKFGLNETQVAKMIKQANKEKRLGVALVDGVYYATNTYWILQLLPYHHNKALAAITEIVGPIDANNEFTAGSLKIKSKQVLDLFNEIVNKDGQDAEFTPWLYNDEKIGILRFIDTPSGSYAFQDCYLNMFDNTSCNKKIVITNSPRPNTHLLVCHFQNEPLGIVLEVINKAGFSDLPRIKLDIAS